jgi:hypothetical protein
VERRIERERYLRALGYKAPAGMVVAATAARLSGDWRAACAAAHVDVHVDLADTARRFGPAEAERIEADLAGFAPDYLRLHLPYGEGLRLKPNARAVLSRRREPFRTKNGRRPGTAVLVLTFPPGKEAAQRLQLRVADVNELSRGWYDLPEWAWFAGAVTERRWAYGASAARLPWHHADGRPYAQGFVPVASPEPDRADEFELMTAPSPEEQVRELWTGAGFRLEEPKRYDPLPYRLGRRQQTLPLLAPDTRRLTHRYSEVNPKADDRFVYRETDGYGLALAAEPGGAMTITVGSPSPGAWIGPAAFVVEAPRDADLMRRQSLTPDQLHPLAHEALFPGRIQDWQPARHDPYAKVRVRCHGEWHTVEVAGASLRIPDHDEAELRRESLLAGLGGKPSGCAAALAGFRTGRKPVPKELRKARRALFARAFHGDTEALLADLRAGADPLVRSPMHGTLMHLLAHVHHEQVLPVLLAAGFSVRDRDAEGSTPLHAAARSADRALMTALIEAGAEPEALDARGRTATTVLAETVPNRDSGEG